MITQKIERKEGRKEKKANVEEGPSNTCIHVCSWHQAAYVLFCFYLRFCNNILLINIRMYLHPLIHRYRPISHRLKLIEMESKVVKMLRYMWKLLPYL
jgi:hypothetical protein